MADIAAELGLSVSTISLAIRQNPRIPEETRNRVVATAQRLGYKANPVLSELMSELRRHRGIDYQRTIALLNTHPTCPSLAAHPAYAAIRQNCGNHAAQHGYVIDEFWIFSPDINPVRLATILHNRNIHGALIIGPQFPEAIRENYASIWRDLTCVGIGLPCADIPFSNTRIDHHTLILDAINNLRAAGYLRPALVFSAEADRLVEGRVSAGYAHALLQLPPTSRLPIYSQYNASQPISNDLLRWLDHYQPDAVISIYPDLLSQITTHGWACPERIGFVLLDRIAGHEHLTHLDQRHDLQCEAAFDLLVGHLTRHQHAPADSTRLILNRPRWVQGATTRAPLLSE